MADGIIEVKPWYRRISWQDLMMTACYMICGIIAVAFSFSPVVPLVLFFAAINTVFWNLVDVAGGLESASVDNKLADDVAIDDDIALKHNKWYVRFSRWSSIALLVGTTFYILTASNDLLRGMFFPATVGLSAAGVAAASITFAICMFAASAVELLKERAYKKKIAECQWQLSSNEDLEPEEQKQLQKKINILELKMEQANRSKKSWAFCGVGMTAVAIVGIVLAFGASFGTLGTLAPLIFSGALCLLSGIYRIYQNKVNIALEKRVNELEHEISLKAEPAPEVALVPITKEQHASTVAGQSVGKLLVLQKDTIVASGKSTGDDHEPPPTIASSTIADDSSAGSESASSSSESGYPGLAL